MEGFPSGQRGQTVNLLSLTSMVRIHLPPPKFIKILEIQFQGFFHLFFLLFIFFSQGRFSLLVINYGYLIEIILIWIETTFNVIILFTGEYS